MGRSPCCTKEGLKKGPWTQEEDEKLIAFVKEHGHGNWRSLPKKCGLLRCGKSCRLRWTNYLRPDIKRGLFTHSEQQKIIQLHALVGNKWAFIASQLPKRTDNEIKNYWNTVLKKRLESKVGLLSQLAGTTKAHSTLITPAAAENKSIKSSATRNNNSDMRGNIIKCSPAVMSFTHLAQWESARLEAEARLGKESQSRKAHNLLSFTHMGHSYSNANHTTTTSATSAFTTFPNSTTTSSASSSFPNSTTTTSTFSSFPNPITNPQSLPQLSNCILNPPNTLIPSSTSNPCLIHHPLTINYPSATSCLSKLPINSLSTSSSLSKLPIEALSNTCSLSNIPAIISMPSSCSASNNSSTSSNIASSKSLSRLSPQESTSSALTLGPTGRLSWQAKEVCFTTSSPISTISQSSFLSQMLCKFDRHLHAHEVELNGTTKGDLGPAGDVEASRGNEQMSLEAISSMMKLNSTVLENCMDLNSTMDNWQDLLFDVENSCSDVVSTSWKLSCSSRREEFTHDATSLINNSTKSSTLEGTNNVQVDQGCTLDLEGLNLLPPFDSIMSCEQYANQHSKELLWDTPPSLSVSSTS